MQHHEYLGIPADFCYSATRAVLKECQSLLQIKYNLFLIILHLRKLRKVVRAFLWYFTDYFNIVLKFLVESQEKKSHDHW